MHATVHTAFVHVVMPAENHRDVALGVTWRTDQPSSGWVEYGETTDLGQVAHDDREVALTLGRTVGSVKALQHRAVSSLQRILEDGDEE